jgi:hypothetical protein
VLEVGRSRNQRVTARARVAASSLRRMLDTWVLTVPSVDHGLPMFRIGLTEAFQGVETGEADRGFV